jgi:hypothetical protein
MSSKGTKGKKSLTESVANPKLPSAMMQTNPKIVMGKPMLIVNTLHKAGQTCVELDKYYMNNYKSASFSSHSSISMTFSTSMRWMSL